MLAVGRVDLAVRNALDIRPVDLVVGGRPVETAAVLVCGVLNQTAWKRNVDSAGVSGGQVVSQLAGNADTSGVDPTTVRVSGVSDAGGAIEDQHDLPVAGGADGGVCGAVGAAEEGRTGELERSLSGSGAERQRDE